MFGMLNKIKTELKRPFSVLFIICTYLIVFAFAVDSPGDIFRGMITIIKSRDVLITDYVEIAGVGATLVNAASASIVMIVYLARRIAKPSGSTIMAFWLFLGFSFFGKNVFNIWPVIFGGYLYSRFRREPFSKYSVAAIMTTSLAPAVSQIAFYDVFTLPIGLILGASTGCFIGFIMSSVAKNTMSSHKGYNLYNFGFAAGIIAIQLKVILENFGIDANPVFFWNTDSTPVLTVFLSILFLFLIFIGLLCGENNKQSLYDMSKRTGRLISDFYMDYGESTYINMGILGLFSTFLIISIGGDINGPVMGAIFTVVGFGAFGKHIKNSVPVMAGCVLGGGFIHINGQKPAAAVAVLFSTCLAPISGTFGWKWGLVAGFLHLNIALNVGSFSSGMNLYNNGLAGGLVAMFLVPLIESLNRSDSNENDKTEK